MILVERPAAVTCRECGETKTRQEFERAWRDSGWCKACRNAYRQRRREELGRELVRFPRMTDAGIICCECRQALPGERFYWRDRGAGPEPGAYCKACAKRRRAEDLKAWELWKSKLP